MIKSYDLFFLKLKFKSFGREIKKDLDFNSLLKTTKRKFVKFTLLGITSFYLSQAYDNKSEISNTLNKLKISINKKNKKSSSPRIVEKISIPLMKNKQLYAQEMLNRKDYFLSICVYCEGFSSNLYKDNKGFAIGLGYNLSMQSEEKNKYYLKHIFTKQEHIDFLSSLSGKNHNDIKLNDYKHLKISPEQGFYLAKLMEQQIEKEIFLGISKHIEKKFLQNSVIAKKQSMDLLKKLTNNEMAALKYHMYKIGYNNFLKYENLLNSLYKTKIYQIGKTEDSSKYFIYKYKKDNTWFRDSHAETMIQSMFLSDKEFASKAKLELNSHIINSGKNKNFII